MNIRKNTTNKAQNRYTIGLQGQDFVESKFKSIGYDVYKKNFRKIGLEIDLIVYKFIESKNLLVIRIVEVKTRRNRKMDLEEFGIPAKWVRVRRVMFDIPVQIKKLLGRLECRHSIAFDLAVVCMSAQQSGEKALTLHRYIRNVNLLL